MADKTHAARRQFLQAAGLLCAGLGWRQSRAEEVLKVLVGFPAGGAIDSTARVYADAAHELGTLVVDNRAGAAGNIAAGALAQSRPDGETMMFAPVNVYCISQALYRSLSFDTGRDFAPVGIIARFPWTLAVHPGVPARDLGEFVKWAKANRNKLDCGMAAVGSEGHLMAYAFARAAGIEFNFVAYKGGAPMAADLMAGHIPFAFDPIVNLAQPHKAGKVRMLALTSTERSPLTPEVPTFREAGYPVATGDTWIGAAMKIGTPPEKIRAVAAALTSAAHKPEVKTKLGGLGLSTSEASPEEMARMITADTERYTALVKSLGLRID